MLKATTDLENYLIEVESCYVTIDFHLIWQTEMLISKDKN